MKPYAMGYSQSLDPRRIEAFFNGKLDINECVILAQDVVEAGATRDYGLHVWDLVFHCIEQGLCTITGRYKQ
ncbi:MAG: hypothetical protein ACYDBH_00335 [Acidobacteriaceae bacterium]